MTTEQIYTALNYPSGVQKIGDGVSTRDVEKYLSANYSANTMLAVYKDKIEAIERSAWKQMRNDPNRVCALVDTQEGDATDIYWISATKKA